MRYLGIDYGARRVGLALSDESGKVAFPEATLDNNNKLLEKIVTLCDTKKVGKIILGESLNYQRQPNPIMAAITEFKKRLEAASNLEVVLEPEWLTSALAARSADKGEKVDDAAAALILQTYLDRADRL